MSSLDVKWFACRDDQRAIEPSAQAPRWPGDSGTRDFDGLPKSWWARTSIEPPPAR